MNRLPTFILLTILYFSCASDNKTEMAFYKESQLSFLDLRNSDWTKNSWIRKQENLIIVHESFKQFGYDKLAPLILKSDNEFLIQGVYIKRNFKNLMDSLELTYDKPEIQTKYYHEFWNRRKLEKNDSIVYEIIKEFNSFNSDQQQPKLDSQYVNDTLVDLLKLEFDNENMSLDKAQSDFYTLKNYGLHQSAYNLLYERSEYSDFDLDREKLLKELDTSKVYQNPWLIDNEK